jgi:four helix bundle protein
MGYKFQRLKIYHLALDYIDKVYGLSRNLSVSERFNLQSQLERAATSIILNIAEGSTGQSNAEQNRFLGLALRSYLETIACLDIIERQGYLASVALAKIRDHGHELFIKLQAFRKSLEGPVHGPRSPVKGITHD